MTHQQQAYYWRLIGMWRKKRLADGKPCGDQERHALHRRALGREKSSTKFTNRDFDAVKSAILAEVFPDDIDSQLAVQEQAEQRHAALMQRIFQLAASCHVTGRADDPSRGLDDYIVHRLFSGKSLSELTETQLYRLRGVLTRRATALTARLSKETTNQPF